MRSLPPLHGGYLPKGPSVPADKRTPPKGQGGGSALSERAQRTNLRALANKAQAASERAGRTAYKNADAALREAYADGVEDVLLYIVGDASPSTWLADILSNGDILNADERA
jgi:hypothetical protein